MRRTYPLIAGGGPAGSAVAIRLANGGARPMLIERSRDSHDVVCGGFLGADAIGELGRLGIDVFAFGAPPIGRVRVIAGHRIVETALPFPAAGLSRRTIDALLIERAAQAGAGIERGIAVRHIDGIARQVDLADGTRLETDALFLATGKHETRGLARPPAAAGADPAIGMRVSLGRSASLTAALGATIELHLFRHGYAGLLLQEDGNANLCLSVAQSRLQRAGGRPEDLLAMLAAEAPLLAERFQAGTPGPWSTIARVPYGWRESATTEGVFRLGDQAAVIASLAGDGVAIALASARMAGEAFLSGGDRAAGAYQQAFCRQASRPIAVASLIRRAGENALLAGPLLTALRHAPSLLRFAASATRITSPSREQPSRWSP